MTEEEKRIGQKVVKTLSMMLDAVGIDEEIEAYVQDIQDLKSGLPYRLKVKLKLELIHENARS